MDVEKRLTALEQQNEQLIELVKAIIRELPDEAQARLAWKLVNDWIIQSAKPKSI